jgi:hypothetical protein
MITQNKKIPLYNPLNIDFTVKYDVSGTRNPVEFVIHAKEIEYFDEFIANHIKTALATEILNRRGIQKNSELDLENIRKEIEVKL